MVRILPEKNWSLPNSLVSLDKVSPKMTQDLCVIFFDVRENEPEVLEVLVDVFQNKSKVSLSNDSLRALREILGTLGVKSNPELMECIRQSQIDKRKGNVRKYEDIARECGLRI
jgi:hypothetical protein